MDFWIILGSIISLFLLYPYVRLLIKRIALVVKLKMICQKQRVVLLPTHRFWYLGSKKNTACDFCIEIEKERYAVKLFSLKKHLSVLMFNNNREYTVRRYVIFFSKFSSALFHFDSKPKTLPVYDFEVLSSEKSEKPCRRILLIHPCGIGVTGANFIRDIEVMSTKELLDEVKRKVN